RIPVAPFCVSRSRLDFLLLALTSCSPSSIAQGAGSEREVSLSKALSQFERSKLQRLAELDGLETIDQLLSDGINCDPTAPSICMSETCNFFEYMDATEDSGYCPYCDRTTVKSCFVI